jgi:RNA polymerase sigma factor (sigma-70 family)
MQPAPTDNEIIREVLQGQQSRYAELVKRYQNFVFSVVLRYTESREDAEELSQDIFVKAYKYLCDFRGDSKFTTWLYTIVTTTCISFLRKKKQEVQSLDNEKVFAMADNLDSGVRANTIEQKSRATMVHRAIALLSPDDAQIISLFYQGEQSLEEISKIMGLETNTVKVRLHRARTRLREKMEKHFAAEVRDI